MKAVYKIEYDGIDFDGNLSGIFIEDSENMKKLKEDDIELQFGDICGKYSDVVMKYNEWNVNEIFDQNVIDIVEKFNLCVGINLYEIYLETLEINN